MIDKNALHDELTNAFIRYQYRIENPFPSPTETPAAMILQYRNDPIFHNKVESIVCGVMAIVGKHEVTNENNRTQ